MLFVGGYNFETPPPRVSPDGVITPNPPTEFKWSLHDVDHVFKKGHTLVVEIQSTWFPLYDRNPQTYVPNIMTAKPSDYKPATITIVSDSQHPSQLTLPVIP